LDSLSESGEQMNVLLVNGSPNERGCTYTGLREIADELQKQEIGSEFFQIGKRVVRGCIACMNCQRTGSGHCIYKEDPSNELIDKLHAADAVVVGSPVYYAGISGQVKCLLDKAFFAGKGFDYKPAAAIVSCRRGGASAAFDQLNHYFTISNMPVISSQYWNQIHGYTPEDVQQDLEGLQTMRTLARNMGWLLRCITAGEQSGISRPKQEPWVPTNFIR